MKKVKAYIFKPRRRLNGKVKTGEFYHLRYQLPGETGYREITLGVRERAVAEEKRRDFIRQHESEAAGIIEPQALRDSAQKRMEDHLADFLADLGARGKDEMYVYNIGKRVGLLTRECCWKYPKHVSAESLLNWRVGHQDKAAKTLNDYLASASALLNWMERQGRIKVNPLRSVAKVDGCGKERRVRRALTIDQMQRLVAVSGPRSLAYLLAAHTGLRRAELAALEWGDVMLDAPRPFLRVRAATTKNHKQATISLLPASGLDCEASRGAGREWEPI
jgi:integrase